MGVPKNKPLFCGLVLLLVTIVLPKVKCDHTHVEVIKCPDSPLRLSAPWRIQVPSYPFTMNVTLRQSTQTFFYCSDNPATSVKNVAYFFTTEEELAELEEEFGPQQARTFLMEKVYLTPQGVLAVDHAMYRGDEFCLFNYTAMTRNGQPELIFRICPTNCSSKGSGTSAVDKKSLRNEPCIKKCCPTGMAVDFSEGHPDCLPSSPDRKVWEGKFYNSRTWKRMSPEEEAKLRPHYFHHILSANCTKFETWFGKVVTQGNNTNPKQSARLLSDGNMIYISGNRRWEVLDGVDFCLDGMQNIENDESSPVSKDDGDSWPESDQVLVICATDFKSAKSRDQSIVYMYFLFGAAFFYWLTALVHGLLWDKQNSNGWSMFCLTLSMGFWSIFMGNAHRLGLDGDPALRKSKTCVANAILAHFFMLAGFTWLTLINYSIWSTFRTLAPRAEGKNLKQLVKFIVIGFGFPLTIVLVGVTLEQIYPDKESLVIIPEYGHNICFVAEYAQGVYIYYILGVLFVIIFTLFAMTCLKLHQFQQDTATVRSKSTAGDRSMAQLYAKLSVVLGITWAFEFISWALTNDGQSWFWAFPDLYNLLTSVIIFVIYACKPTTIHQMEQKYPFIKPVTQAVGKVVTAARQTFQSEPASNSTGTSHVYQQGSIAMNASGLEKGESKSGIEMSRVDISTKTMGAGGDKEIVNGDSKER